ncbi:MAG: HTTM domain-containing protein [Pseudomonadota bacterium]|nr:HTTM domain-containing protein [Pseudomonadota bacterium]
MSGTKKAGGGVAGALSGWFLPAWPAARLGVLRFALGAYVLQDLVRVRRPVLALSGTDPAQWDPVGVTTWIDGPLSADAWAFTHDATIVVGVLFTLGLFWRVTAPLFAAFLLFVWTYRVSWQMIYHVHHLAMLHVLVMACAPAAAAVSLDATFGRRWRWLTSQPGGRGDSWHYGWPVRLLCIVTTLSYLMAGIAKLQIGGLDWAAGSNLLDQVAYDGIYKHVLAPDSEQPGDLIGFAYRHSWIMFPLAMGSLVLESLAPIALVHRRVGQLWSVATMGMHWGIHLFMNLVFPYPISGMAFLSFFPVEKLVPRRWHGESELEAGESAA